MDSACRVQEFARRAGVDVALRDIIEWFWVKDIADLTWEILRIRRFKVGIIDVAKKSALEAIMLSLTETGEMLSFDLNCSSGWQRNGSLTRKRRRRSLRCWRDMISMLRR